MAEIFFDVEQGSLDWHLLRADKRTASEAPACMEVNPWKPRNRRELAAVKSGELFIEETWAMTRGKDNEEAARQWLNRQLNVELRPAVVVEGEYLASLDGLTEDTSIIGEIKIPVDPEKLADAIGRQDLPKHYWWQLVQQAALVPEADGVAFCCYDPEQDRGWYWLIEADELRADWPTLLAAWEEFGKTDHGPLEYDRETVPGFKVAAKNYTAALRKLEEQKAIVESRKQKLLELCEDDDCGTPNVGYGLRIQRIFRKGSVNTKKLYADKGITPTMLEQYRGEGTSYWAIKGEYDA